MSRKSSVAFTRVEGALTRYFAHKNLAEKMNE